MRDPGTDGAAGLTLIELILMITIIGILAFLAAPQNRALHEVKLRTAARRLVADLRYAQGRAVHRGERHGVLFEADSDRYTVFAPIPEAPVPDPAHPGRALGIDFRHSDQFQGVRIAKASFGRTPGVTFDSFGVPADTSGRALTEPALVVLALDGDSAAIEMAPRTGKVTLR